MAAKKIKKGKVWNRWRWEAAGKFIAIFVTSNLPPLNSLNSIPPLDVLAYQADMEIAVYLLNPLEPVKRKASKAWFSFKWRE